MREILFRGQRVDNGEWVQGFLVDTQYIRGPLLLHPVDPATVGQYTGLTDKNGKPIFEDDVVIPTLNDGNYQGYSWGQQKVVFDCGAFCVEDRYRQALPLKSFSPRVEIEVVGNIHDNPELLEGGGAK